MATMKVLPRPTPAERADDAIDIEVDEGLTVLAATIEDWCEPRQDWDYAFREGHDRGRGNNVVVELIYAAGPTTSSLSFRLDQLDTADDTGSELVLIFDERDGISKLARITENGLDVDLFHILTFT